MTKRAIDIGAILAPIAGDNPAGEDLRYTPVYDTIKEARRAEDQLHRGDWQREVKTSDWDSVISQSVDALITRSKDLQIAAWLAEALAKTDGFSGLATGLKILTSLLRDYWKHVYPEIEEGDLEFRAAPLESLNNTVWVSIKQIPLTDASVTPGHSWLKWQESRKVGYEADTRNQYGDVDDAKKKARDELTSEGQLTAEDFDSAVALSSRAYYESLMADITACRKEFHGLDETVDERFGASAPRLAELKGTIEDCERVVARILKDKGAGGPAPGPQVAQEVREVEKGEAAIAPYVVEEAAAGGATPEPEPPAAARRLPAGQFAEEGALERAAWQEAVEVMKTSGMRQALEQLLAAACSAPSVRERGRYRLLMARLCLKANRPDLARPIVEELHSSIEELHLDRWESPTWIAEVLDALYQCLTAGEPSDDDVQRARALFRRLCTTDVTKAMIYRQ